MEWIIFSVLLIIFLIGISAFFSCAEMAFVSINRALVKDKAREGDRNAKILDKLLQNPEKVISTVVIGNNLSNILASILAGAVATIFFGNIGIGVATFVMMFIVIIFCEIVPKSYGLRNMQFVLHVARLLSIITRAFQPLVIIVTGISNFMIHRIGRKEQRKSIVTEKEIMAMLRLGELEGTIEHDEHEMVKEVFEFNDTRAFELVIPKEKVVFIHETDTIANLIQKSITTGFSRFPVYRKDLDDIVGMVHVKDILSLSDKTLPIKSIMRSILKFDSNMKADDILRSMKNHKTHLAILQTPDGKTLGLLSMEDLIEEVFGEINDEHDHQIIQSKNKQVPELKEKARGSDKSY
jgi:putative hemolysin